MRASTVLAILLLVSGCRASYTSYRLREPRGGPRILCVVAHPDDEIAFAGALYKTATYLSGRCDVLAITNGEGGFKYSTLAEELYGVELTDEAIGRTHLPAIRRRELLAGCDLLCVANVHFLNQRDHRYTQDPMEVLAPDAEVWDVDFVRAAIGELLTIEGYDFVLLLAPTESTHGHHKAAAILAAEAVAALPEDERPVLLCARTASADDPSPTYSQLEGFPVTRASDGEPFVFDRTQRFGHRDQLDYRIVVNWAIAEHRSQGTMQLLMNEGERELYFALDAGPSDARERAAELFTRLAEPQFAAREYGPSAGTNAGASR